MGRLKKRLRISVPVNPLGGVDSHLLEWMFSPELDRMAKPLGWEIERAICRDRPVVSTRNRLVKQFLDSECDALLTVDSDQIPQLGAKDMIAGLDRMLEALGRDDVDVVNAITLRGTERGPVPVITKIVAPLKGELFTEILAKPRGLHELKHEGSFGAMGGAAIMVKRHVLEKFREKNIPWFWDVFAEEQDKFFDELSGDDLWGQRLIGHDYWFFSKCHELGFRCWVDTKSFWGHVKPSDLRAEWRREMQLLGSLAEARKAPTLLAEMLRDDWGRMFDLTPETNWSAPGAFIARMMEEAAQVPEDKMIVECGSGLTSVILTRMIPKERLVILEHDDSWFKAMTGNVNGSLRWAPLEDRGDYEWYRLPELKKEVGLVVCDGPPDKGTKGGRIGAMKELWPHLSEQFVFMLDDTHRPREKVALKAWGDEFGVVAKHYDGGSGRAFSVLDGVKK